jgi:hypothetical protein
VCDYGRSRRGKGYLYEFKEVKTLTSPTLEAKVNTCTHLMALSMRSSHLGAEFPPLSRFLCLENKVWTFDDIILAYVTSFDSVGC